MAAPSNDAPPMPQPPKTVPYSFRRLKDVPRRLTSAPALPDWMTDPRARSSPGSATTMVVYEEDEGGMGGAKEPARSAKGKKGQTGFRKVRSFKKTCMAEVKLADVLEARHTPPLTLRDFEDYLVYVERAPENLYFIFWHNAYRKLYSEWEADLARPTSRSHPHNLSTRSSSSNIPSLSRQTTSVSASEPTSSLSDTLEASRAVALQAFFPPSSAPATSLSSDVESLELNLSEEIMRKTRLDAQASSHPDVFKAARKEAYDMLEESMRRWLILCAGNADNNRVAFAVGLGLFSIAASLAACLVAYYYTPHRALRLPSMPVFWLGVMTFSCALHRMCPVIWLFSSSRQLHNWELFDSSASLSASTLVFPPRSSGTSPDHSPNLDAGVPEKKPAALHEAEYEEGVAIALPRDEESVIAFTPSFVPRSADSVKRIAPDWDAALEKPSVPGSSPSRAVSPLAYFNTKRFESNPASNALPRRGSIFTRPASPPLASAPTFAPVTRVESPLVVRSQRRQILLASMYATAFTVAWIVLWMLLPRPSKFSS